MEHRRVDVAILGAGTAGLTARRSAESAGASALLIDPGPLGTTCARVGCMPSKLLIAAADAAWHAQHAGIFGVDTTVSVDGPRVLARVRAERDRFVGFVLASTDAIAAQGHLLTGRARFLDATTLAVCGPDGVDHTRVEARAVVIATGSSSFVPPPFRALGDALMGNDEVFELTDLPKSVLVVGTGVIGLELGQALHRLGVRVTIVGIDGVVGPLSDPKMVALARAVFGAELDLHPDYALRELRRDEDGVFVSWTDPDGAAFSGTYERVLVAAGRRPNLYDIGLESALPGWNGRSVPAFDPHTMQIGDQPLFLAGDVNNDRPLLHEAADEGHIAGENAARYPNPIVRPRRTSLGVVFTDPQVAVVGERWGHLRCDEHRVGDVDYGDQGRARVMGRNRGRVRVYGEAGTGRLLGAEMIGPDVEHTSHLLAWAIQQRMTVTEALGMPFYHPVVEEGIRTALRDLQSNLRQARPPGARCEEFGPGA